jgi:hypothetical protein
LGEASGMGAFLFCCSGLFLWMVARVIRKEQAAEALGGERAVAPERKGRGTRVRTRCGGSRTPGEEVERQLRKAMPHIVKANVEKAKEGSLIHTKWLWGVAEKAWSKGSEEHASAKASLAQLLMEQLNEVV